MVDGLSASERVELERLEFLEAIGGSLAAFGVAVDDEFVVYRHVDLLISFLERVEAGGLSRLCISMPPRHSKSFVVSRFFVLWWLFKRRSAEVILCAHSQSLANRFSRELRDLCEATSSVTGLVLDSGFKARDRWGVVGGGRVLAAGADGPTTGEGADLFVMDDPYKASDAFSPARRAKILEWFHSDAMSRLSPSGVMVVIQTRWHEDDLIGSLMGDDASGWEYLRLPALADEEDDPLGRELGEALCPERYSVADLELRRREMGVDMFSALYQQRPVPRSGGMFKAKDMRYWGLTDRPGFVLAGGELVDLGESFNFVVVDSAGTVTGRSDFSVVASFAVSLEGSLLVVNARRGRWGQNDLLGQIRLEWESVRSPMVLGIERAPISVSLIDDLREEGFPLEQLIPHTYNKFSRASATQALMEREKLFFAPKGPDFLWVSDFVDEVLRFGPGVRFDDQVDVLGWAVWMMRNSFVSEGSFNDLSEFGDVGGSLLGGDIGGGDIWS